MITAREDKHMKISRIEKTGIKWIQSHLFLIFVIFITACAVLLRFLPREFASYDASVYLLPWYDEIQAGGGLSALENQVGNYNAIYQLLIALMTYLPVEPLYAYKILSCLFDFALAGAASYAVYALLTDHQKGAALAVWTAVLLSPVVLLNSAVWAQCDAIYVFFILAAFICLCSDHDVAAFILLGFAFAFKLQAVFALPFFLLMWFMKKKFSVLNFLIIPIVMIVVSIPAMVMGRADGVLSTFSIYLSQTGEYELLYDNYPSIWGILSPDPVIGYVYFRNIAIVITVVVLICFAAIWIRRNVAVTSVNALYMLFLLSYSCVLFLPAMHERYGYLYEILAILIAVVNKKTRFLLIPLLGITVITYSQFLFGMEINLFILSVVNVLIFALYAFLLMRDLCLKPEVTGSLQSNS